MTRIAIRFLGDENLLIKAWHDRGVIDLVGGDVQLLS